MFAVALDPNQLPHMLALAKSFVLMDMVDVTLTDNMPEELAGVLEYLGKWASPAPETEVQARTIVHAWLDAYAVMYGVPVAENDLGVDSNSTPH